MGLILGEGDALGEGDGEAATAILVFNANIKIVRNAFFIFFSLPACRRQLAFLPFLSDLHNTRK